MLLKAKSDRKKKLYSSYWIDLVVQLAYIVWSKNIEVKRSCNLEDKMDIFDWQKCHFLSIRLYNAKVPL